MALGRQAYGTCIGFNVLATGEKAKVWTGRRARAARSVQEGLDKHGNHLTRGLADVKHVKRCV